MSFSDSPAIPEEVAGFLDDLTTRLYDARAATMRIVGDDEAGRPVDPEEREATASELRALAELLENLDVDFLASTAVAIESLPVTGTSDT